jgi:chromosome segregation ATPase
MSAEELDECKQALAAFGKRMSRMEDVLQSSRILSDARRRYITTLEAQLKAAIVESHACLKEIAELRVQIASLEHRIEELTHQVTVKVIES